MRRKRVELSEQVIYCAREFIQHSGPYEALAYAVEALDNYDAAEMSGVGARWVHGSPETSRDAAGLAEAVQGSTRREIVGQLATVPDLALPGYTDEQLERRLSKKHQTVSSARNWLVEAGWVRDSGVRRRTNSNRAAVVWELTPAAWKQLKGGS